MDELVAFVLGCIDEDERVARACQYQNWTRDGASIYSGHPTEQVVDWVYDEGGWDHIALHDPARELLEVEAKRAMVEQCVAQQRLIETGAETPGFWLTPDFVLTHIALPYADRPGYREEWKP